MLDAPRSAARPPRPLLIAAILMIFLPVAPPLAAQEFAGEPIDQAYVLSVARPRSPQVVAQIRTRAEQGDVQAQNSLGHLFEIGDGVEQSYADALIWYRRAANGGHPAAQESLAHFYLHGHGVPSDLAVASSLYRAGAEEGRATSQNVYGILRAGAGDNVGAVKWFREAMALGSAAAHHNLGVMYERGTGVPKSLAQAQRLYQIGAAKGEETSRRALDRLAAQ